MDDDRKTKEELIAELSELRKKISGIDGKKTVLGQGDELKECEERFRDLVALLPQPVFETDENGYLTFINEKACELYGYSMEEFSSGFRAFQGIAPEDRERGAKNFQRILQGERFPPNEYTAIRKDGTRFPVMIISSPIFRHNRPAGTRGIIIDLRDRIRREEETQRIRRLESIGALAAGIAHEFNNYATAILGNITLAKMDADTDTVLHTALSDAERELGKSLDLSRQLLFFSDRGQPVKKPVPLGKIVKNTARLSLRTPSVSFDVPFPDDCCIAVADELLLGQAIGNLLTNAEEAMPGGGTIEISCGIADLGRDHAPALREGKYGCIRIKDYGVGIPQENRGKLFDPYFSTKKGRSGLGLTTAYFIIKKHGGHIEVESEAGASSAFSVFLPLSERVGEEKKGEEVPRERKGKILLMDDSESLRVTVARLLRRFGYEVGTAKGGEEAIALYRDAMAEGLPFDAVVLDLTVPGGMGGREAVGRLQEIDPEVRAIVSSGYPQDPVMSHPEKYGFRGVVPKPYDIKDLVAALARALTLPEDETAS